MGLNQWIRILTISCLLFFFVILLRAENNGRDTIDFEKLESQIKRLLPDSVDEADSLALCWIEYTSGLSDSLKAIGWYYRAEASYYRGKFNEAGDFYRKSISLSDSFDTPKRKAVYYNNLGLTRYFKGRYNEALDAFLKSAEYEQQVDNNYGFAQCIHNMALVQDRAGEDIKADKYFEHSLELFLSMDSLPDVAAVYNDYAISLANRSSYEAAIEKYSKALDIYKKFGNKEGEAKVRCNIGSLYLFEKNYDLSVSYLEEALTYFKENRDSSSLISTYSLFGNLYFEQDRTALAVVFYDRAESIAKDKGWDDLRRKNLFLLFKALKAEKEYKEALNVLETYSQLKDSLIVANKAFLAETMDNEIETELMEKELTLVRAKVREKNLIMVILVLVLILGLFAWFLYGRSEMLKNEKEKQRLQHKIIQVQMNPHFLFNSMASMQSYILSEQKEEAVDFLSDIALVIRKIMEVADKELIPLSEEIDLLGQYLKVQCRRYYKAINCCNVSSDVISKSDFLMVPPMLARPLVDKIFESGNLSKDCCPGIKIFYEQKDNDLEVTLENSGGVILNKFSDGDIDLIEERLRRMKQTYKSGRSCMEIIDIISNGTIAGTRIKYWLPIIEEG
jgi:tetratricopeptide (TPR) repeat protein